MDFGFIYIYMLCCCCAFLTGSVPFSGHLVLIALLGWDPAACLDIPVIYMPPLDYIYIYSFSLL